ncbi:MAG: nitrilase, partial [Acidobacteria bacterium]
MLTFGQDGTLLNAHRKIMPTYTERMIWGQGDGSSLRAVTTGAGRIGGLICWEHWMPLARQVLHQSGEDIHIAAWPQVKEMNLIASRHYAFEGRCFVIACGAVMRASELPVELEPIQSLKQRPDSLV